MTRAHQRATSLTLDNQPLPTGIASISSVGVVTYNGQAFTSYRFRVHHRSTGFTDEAVVAVIRNQEPPRQGRVRHILAIFKFPVLALL